MAYVNNFLRLSGNLGNDPELRTVEVGGESRSVLNLSIAVQKGSKDNPRTVWFRVAFWGVLADNITAMGVKKGDYVSVTTDVPEAETYENNAGETAVQMNCVGDSFALAAKPWPASSTAPAATPDDSLPPF